MRKASHWRTGYLLTPVFVFSLIYDAYRWALLQRAFGKFFGAVETLRILGFIPPRDGEDTRNKKPIFEEGVSMVKRWFTEKKEAQEKVYAPV